MRRCPLLILPVPVFAAAIAWVFVVAGSMAMLCPRISLGAEGHRDLEKSNRFYGMNGMHAEPTPAARPDELPLWDRPHGPIHLNNQSPLHQLRLAPTPELPTVLAPGQLEIRLDIAWTNYWARESGLAFDFDAVTIQPAVRIGVTEWLEIGITPRLSWRGVSVLGGLIAYWHRMIGHAEDRDFDPPHQFYFIREGHVELDRSRHIGWGLGDWLLQAKVPLIFDATHTTGLSATAMLKLPIGNSRDNFASAGIDVGLVISGMISERQFTAYAAIGYIRHSRTQLYGFAPREHQFVSWAGIEIRFGPAVALHVNLLFHTGLADDHPEIARENMELHVGLSFRVVSGLLLHLTFMENTFSVANAIDMGWHLGLTFHP